MVRKMLQAGVFAALGLISMLATYGVATTTEDKVPDPHTIMSKTFGKNGLLKGTIAADIKGEKWEDAQKHAKELSDYGAALGKNAAPKGDAKSWEELTKKFAENTKAVYDATEKKDAKAATTAMSAIGKTCKECHSNHKP